MNFVCIYGPPASGKLTIATELAELTGYKVFQNNLTVSLVGALFTIGTPKYDELLKKYRLAMIREAANAGLEGLIFTFCYAKRSDSKFIEKVNWVIERSGGRSFFVHLSCDEEMLLKRFVDPSRKKHGKATDVELLRVALRTKDFSIDLPNVDSLHIDTTRISARNAAMKIKERYRL